MLADDDLWLMEEDAFEERSDLLRMMPEIRHYLDPERGEERGLRSLLEQPEALSKAWRRRG